MCRSMVDIQSVAAEIRRGKKKKKIDRRKKLQGKNIIVSLHKAAINTCDVNIGTLAVLSHLVQRKQDGLTTDLPQPFLAIKAFAMDTYRLNVV